jgi:hypothetical protein
VVSVVNYKKGGSMVTKEELKKMLLGKRVLYTMTLSSQVPPIEAEVLEISPSGNYIKLQRMDGACTWEVVSSIYIADVLDEGGLVDFKSRWIPARNETYWYIDENGDIKSSPWSDNVSDRSRFSFGNIFQINQQAEGFRNKIQRAFLIFHRSEATKDVAAKEKEQANNKSS